MKILFMLPARSGSKGVPNKNIKLICGKPLIFYAINAIKSSETFNNHECTIMVNTDSDEYKNIVTDFGVEVPFIRPGELSGDSSKIKDTIAYTFDYYEKIGKDYDLFAMIQVTSPLLTADDIDNTVNSMIEAQNKFDSVCSVTESEVMPLWCNTLDDSLSLNNFIPSEIRIKNRQELPIYYRLTGAIRIAKWKQFKENNFDFLSNSKAIILTQENSIDIDTNEDFLYAEYLLNRRLENNA